MKGAQHLHCGSYKTLLKAIREDLNRWKAFSMCGLEDGVDDYFPDLHSQHNPIKIPAGFFA